MASVSHQSSATDLTKTNTHLSFNMSDLDKPDFMQMTNEQRMEMFLGASLSLKCETHGDYIGYAKDRTCPECAETMRKRQEFEDAKERRRKYLASRWSRSGLPEKFCNITLDDWKERTPKHAEVKAVARRFIDGDIVRMLLIGNCGTGKTMLAAGIIGEMSLKKKKQTYSQAVNNQGEVSIFPGYITATRLIRSIRDTWKTKDMTEQEAMNKYIDVDVLVIDELGAGRCSDDDKLILSEILCDRYSANMPTLLISNMTGEQLKADVLDDRAVDRMREGGEVIVMNWQSERGSKI